MIPGRLLKVFKIFVLPKNLLDKLANLSNDVALIMQWDIKNNNGLSNYLTYCSLLGRRNDCRSLESDNNS